MVRHKHLSPGAHLLGWGDMRSHYLWALVLLTLPLTAAERKFDFSEMREDQPPPGFRSTVTGQGKPGDWQVIMDAVPPLLQPLTTRASAVSKRAVLAQLAQDPADEHFPLLIYEGETFGDFTLTTRFKTVKGVAEQMAGIAFRIQNETNYYVVRASSLGNTFRFYKVLNGERGPLVGPEVKIPSGVWHELTVECKGNQIRGRLDGEELITATDQAVHSQRQDRVLDKIRLGKLLHRQPNRLHAARAARPGAGARDDEAVSTAARFAGLCVGQ